MDKIRTLVLEDEPEARRLLRDRLRRESDVELVDAAPAALDRLHRQPVDLLFLDVQQAGADGFDRLRALDPARAPAVICTGACDRYALQAFDAHALDFLLKPLRGERLERALNRARDHIRRARFERLSRRLLTILEPDAAVPPPPAPVPAWLDRLTVRSGGRLFIVKTGEIDWIEGAGVYLRVHAGGRAHLLRERMGVLERGLDPKRFIRIHRSTIVNVDRIAELKPHLHGEYFVVLRDGTSLKLSRSHRERLQSALRPPG